MKNMDIKNNHKPTTFGWIPSEWEIKKLEQLGQFSKGKGILKEELSEKGLPCIRYGEIYTTHEFVINDFKSFISKEIAKESQAIKSGDILFAGSGETIEEIGKAVAYVGDAIAYAGGDIVILSTNNSVSAMYISYALETSWAKKQKRRIGQGNQIVHIYPTDLATIQIPIPNSLEQNKIVDILASWDKAINTTEQLIEQSYKQKQYLVQTLLPGKVRLKGYNSKWKAVKLGDITKKISRRNKVLEDAEVYSVTNHDGFVLQSEQFEREIAGDDLSNYKIIKKNEFAYNPARINVGSIAYFQNDMGIISSLYVCFTTTKDISDQFLLQLLELDHTKHRIISHGEGGVRIYLWYELFAQIKISLPSIEEQMAITNILETVDKKIDLLKHKLDLFHNQKKWLMQQLLTGKKRVKVN